MSDSPLNDALDDAPTVQQTGIPLPLPQPGQALYGYALERELGRGSAGVVFLARDSLGHAVALKVLRAISPKGLERLRREAQTMNTLEHPGIVRVRAA